MERTTIPIPDVEVHGNKTLLKNFNKLSKTLRREPLQFSRYLSKKLATRCRIQGGALKFQGAFSKTFGRHTTGMADQRQRLDSQREAGT
jgi:translation initiation factor 2 beta subunit (eIF-2beta)/eIF-5